MKAAGKEQKVGCWLLTVWIAVLGVGSASVWAEEGIKRNDAIVVSEGMLAAAGRSEVVTPAEAVALLPEALQPASAQALTKAGANAAELIAAIEAADPAQRPGLGFLIANMPERDLKTLNAGYLIDNVQLAYQTREETPWGKLVPEDLFLDAVLPYANVSERRDSWRADFYSRFLPIAKEAGTIEQAVKKLNQAVFQTLNVVYHPTKRPRPDASPYESIDSGYASCTGLSILLVDALRAVGIPARLAGIPQWTDHSGNHSWVEVWDQGWHFIGASEPSEYDQTWFAAKTALADPTRPEHRIYAVSFQNTGLSFPMVWAPTARYVWALDVTARYTADAPTVDSGQGRSVRMGNR